MSRTVLILGAKGRFGRAASKAFLDRGWTIKAFARSRPDKATESIEWIAGDATQAGQVAAAAPGCELIVNALTPPYSRWTETIPLYTRAAIAGAEASGASIIVPGNVYNFGRLMPGGLSEDTPHRASSRLGLARIDMEAAYRAAAGRGVRTLILRAGDFLEREATGNWFDSQITAKLGKGIVVYPGPLDSVHSWAYLPDLGRAAAELAEIRHTFEPFEVVHFPGYAMTGGELVKRLETLAGRPLAVKTIPWPMIRLLSLFKPDLRGVVEMSYLWRTPHRMDGAKFSSLLPRFAPTPVQAALADAVSDRLAIRQADSAGGEVSHVR